MAKKFILAVQVTDRLQEVPRVQQALSEHGCNIKTRLGLHEVGVKSCSTTGILILEMVGKEAEILDLEKKLKKIKGIKVKKIVFA